MTTGTDELPESESKDDTQAVSLNDSAAYLIESVRDEDFTSEDWVDLLTERYDVSKEQATADVESLIHMLQEANVID